MTCSNISLGRITFLFLCLVILVATNVFAVMPNIKPAYDQYKDNPYHAAVILTKVITNNTKDAYAYYNRGLAYIIQGNYDQAILDFSKTIELVPTYRDEYLYRAIAYHCKGVKRDDVKYVRNIWTLINYIQDEYRWSRYVGNESWVLYGLEKSGLNKEPAKTYFQKAQWDLDKAEKLGYSYFRLPRPVK